MSITCGFFNSLNGDRRYDARQMASIFDGLILDGVFASIGTAFIVKATTGQTVNVGIGKAWFNHTWTLNDSILPLEAPDSEILLDRIDAVVLEVNHDESVRANTIKFVKGEPSSSPVRPEMIKSGGVYQYPLCYIYRKSSSTAITQADITNMVGKPETPFITGLLRVINIDEVLGQWEDQLDQYLARETASIDAWFAAQDEELRAWVEAFKADCREEARLLDEWTATEKEDFLAWYQSIKDQLSEDQAGNLQLQIDREEIDRVLLVGFANGTKEILDEGRKIISTSDDGRTLTKTFSSDFLTITVAFRSEVGGLIADLVKTFSPDGNLLSNTITYY